MITVNVTYQGMDQVLAKLDRLNKLGKDAEPVLRAMGNTLKSITEGNFSSVGASFRPIPWVNKVDGKPSNLKQSTLLSKSFFLTTSKTEAVLGTPVKYAAIHQFGGTITAKNKQALRFKIGDNWVTRKSVTIPARPFFPMTPGGKLTSQAANLVVRSAERAIEKIINSKPS